MKKMVLIVDDSPTDIELTMIALEAAELEVDVCSATDGKSALSMLNDGCGSTALVLLDLKMPGMDGIEVLRKIRADAKFKELPVVIVTSSSLESDRVDTIAAGATEYFQKPLALTKFSNDLKSIVDRWLSN